jgi:hypothetical protein
MKSLKTTGRTRARLLLGQSSRGCEGQRRDSNPEGHVESCQRFMGRGKG